MRLKQDQYFIDAYEMLCKKRKLTQKDKEYILGAAVLLLKIYNNDENKREYFELAYHIVLNYSIFTKDYEPLNDIAYNYGFFPIVRFINTKRLLNNISINEILYDCSLEKYKNGTYVETLEQNMTRKNLMKSNGDVCFIAPTSSGKSSIISNHIKNNEANKKSLVIVPSKSLLAQTYMEIRKNISDRKIICHDEMYNDEEKFIRQSFIILHNKLLFNYKQILIPLQTALQDLKLKKFSGKTQVMDIHKEIAKLREQAHVLARLKTKGFLDEAKYIEQTTELTAKINKLQSELKKLTRSDYEDETLDQIEILIDFFEKRDKPITEFEESTFESIVEKIVVIDQHELEFHLIGGLKFKENI